MSVHNSLVATYANLHLAEATVKKMRQNGFDMHKVSVVGKDQKSAADLEGATRLNSLDELDRMQFACIPMERLPDYEAELNGARTLVVTHGTPDEINQAKRIMDSVHPESLDGKVWSTIYYGCVD